MDLGATVCRPNAAPLCGECPVRESCGALREGCAGDLPVKAPKKARRIEERTVLLVLSEKGVLLHRRPPEGLLAGLWEFPSLSGRQSASGVGAHFPPGTRLSSLASARHVFSHIEWQMTGFLARARSAPLPSEDWRWADGRALREEYAVPSAFKVYLRLASALLQAEEGG